MKLVDYIKDTKSELKHVSWPTRKQAITFTIIVVLISIVVAIYLGALDALFTFLLSKIVV